MIVRVILTNRFAQFIEPYPVKQLTDIFSYIAPNAFFTPAYKQRVFDSEKGEWVRKWDGKKTFMKNGYVPAGLFLDLKDKIEKEWDVVFKVEDERENLRFTKIEKSDRAFQNKCVRAMKENSSSGGIILIATRLGKTRTAGMFFKSLKGRGVFVVDELTLLKQARRELKETVGERIGIIGKSEFEPRRISVATIQTLFKHRSDPKFKKWKEGLDAMIIDEIHAMLSKRNSDVVNNIHPKAVYGLTATLQHHKKHIRMKATALAGPIIFQYNIKKGVKNKYLVPGVVVGVNITRKGFYKLPYWEDYDALIAKSRSYNDVVRKLIRTCLKRDKHILTLVERVPHVRRLSNKLEDIDHRLAYGKVKVDDRLRAKSAFDKDKIKLIIANKVFAKGITLAKIDVAIDATSLPGENAAQQKYGRGIGLCDKKQGLIYFDIGFKNPPLVKKKSPHFNRFSIATKKRRKALARLGVEIHNIDWNGSAKEVVDFAEKKLKSVLRKHR